MLLHIFVPLWCTCFLLNPVCVLFCIIYVLFQVRRRPVMSNHTGTHVLNFALRKVLGMCQVEIPHTVWGRLVFHESFLWCYVILICDLLDLGSHLKSRVIEFEYWRIYIDTVNFIYHIWNQCWSVWRVIPHFRASYITVIFHRWGGSERFIGSSR